MQLHLTGSTDVYLLYAAVHVVSLATRQSNAPSRDKKQWTSCFSPDSVDIGPDVASTCTWNPHEELILMPTLLIDSNMALVASNPSLPEILEILIQSRDHSKRILSCNPWQSFTPDSSDYSVYYTWLEHLNLTASVQIRCQFLTASRVMVLGQ